MSQLLEHLAKILSLLNTLDIMTLKSNPIEVSTEDGFVFKNRTSVEIGRTTDMVKRENPTAGTAELIERVAAEEFSKSCIYWPLQIALSEDNAIDFYLSHRDFAVKQIKEAKVKIKEELDSQLKNLLAGLNGGLPPAE